MMSIGKMPLSGTEMSPKTGVMLSVFILLLATAPSFARITVPNSGNETADKLRVILDTDPSSDPDDVGCMAMLHSMASNGECEILAVINSINHQEGSLSISAINHFYNRPAIPVGDYKGYDSHSLAPDNLYSHMLAKEYPRSLDKYSNARDSVSLYREILASAEPKSITIVVIGTMHNLSALLKSEACRYSSLNGIDLVEEKVRQVVTMGGNFIEGKGHDRTNWGGSNALCSYTSWSCLNKERNAMCRFVIENCKAPFIASGWEVGCGDYHNAKRGNVMTGQELKKLPAKHIVRRSYEYHFAVRGGDEKIDRHSNDQCALLYAVRGEGENFKAILDGEIELSDTGDCSWKANKDHKQGYIRKKRSKKLIAAEIEDLMMGAVPAIDDSAPTAPTDLGIETTKSQFHLQWNAANDPTPGSWVAGYRIYHGNDQIGLAHGTQFFVDRHQYDPKRLEVRSVNCSGVESSGTTVTVNSTNEPINRKPRSGELYREFCLHNGGDRDWRVTDKDAVIKFERAKHHLPNSQLRLDVADLQHAIGAEVLLDRWGGHRGTINKRIRFNGNEWITIPEIANTPRGIRPEMLMYQDNPVVAVPIEQLAEGINVIETDCDEEGGFGWGQWGLYSIVLRVFYDPKQKGSDFAISGRIASPASGSTMTDNPVIEIEAAAAMGVARVDVLAAYDGYDEDGDGVFNGYHESRFQLVRGAANEIRDHVGTLWRKPYRVTWKTDWVPDQKPETISLVARVQDCRGYWYVTEPVTGLTLARDDFTVRLYRPRNVPEDFAVRVGETKTCMFDIPASDPISPETEARLHLRTWHGWDEHHEPLKINDHEMNVDGKNHFYDYDMLEFPATALKHGENTFSIHSKTEHHMLEVLWPGPAIVTRTPLDQNGASNVKIREDEFEDRPHFVIETTNATYWLDRNSGGLSRLIDNDGNDWISFKKEPWGEYPAAAASSFRGLPNLVFNGDDKGFGHPGWDQADSTVVDNNTIVCRSTSRQWELRWEFLDDKVKLVVEKAQSEQPYWFLYEGPIGGRWSPKEQYFATNEFSPDDKPRDYFKGDKLFSNWRWAYFGDKSQSRVLAIVHDQADELADTFSHLGNSESGLQSKDGMVVFGFGRGPNGIEPLLTKKNSFQIRFFERSGFSLEAYEEIKKQLEQEF